MRVGETIEYCHQHTKMNEMCVNDSVLYQHFMDDQTTLEAHAKNYVPEKAETIYTVPIVFHILHGEGADNISDAQIFDALHILNRDYRKENIDATLVKQEFQGVPADIEIEFKMATLAPDGTCFNGITRTRSTLTNSNDGELQFTTALNQNDVFRGEWPHDKYLNVIVAKAIGGAAGYTYKPNNSGASYNAIYIQNSYLGTIGTGSEGRSRALTHEVGHWLNLSHTWGDNNDPGDMSSCNDDDGIADTPNTIGVTTCKLSENSCGPLANVENYMDYSYCSKMFTPGQRTRMRVAITSSVGGRNKLWKETNLIATGVVNAPLCRADFSVSKRVFCAGETVQFTDRSVSQATAWSWTFEGGMPATSSEQHPSVSYNEPGRYTVILVASNNDETKTETKTAYINVTQPYATLPYHEGFEYFPSVENASMKLFVESIGDPITFEITSTASFSGNKSLKLNNFEQQGVNLDNLISTPIDLSNEAIGNVTLSYRYAHAKKNSSNKEHIRAYFSKGCDAPWVLRTQNNKSSLASSPIDTQPYTPPSGDWVTVHIPFDSPAYNQFLTENFRFKLEFSADGGNNFYLDDINLYQGFSESTIHTNPQDSIDYQNHIATMGIADQTLLLHDASIFPNPNNGEAQLTFSIQQTQQVVVSVQDVSGKTLKQTAIYAGEGLNTVYMNNAELSSGIYFVKITAHHASKTLTFIKN